MRRKHDKKNATNLLVSLGDELHESDVVLETDKPEGGNTLDVCRHIGNFIHRASLVLVIVIVSLGSLSLGFLGSFDLFAGLELSLGWLGGTDDDLLSAIIERRINGDIFPLQV